MNENVDLLLLPSKVPSETSTQSLLFPEMSVRSVEQGESQDQTEHWKTVVGFPRYECSTLGRVRNKFKGKIISQFRHATGYMHINLGKDGKQHPKLVHRVIALTWLVKPSEKHTEVNHKNRVRHDNRLDNLEWMTRSDNAKHGRGTLT